MKIWILLLLLGSYQVLAQTNIRAQYALSRLSDNGGLSPNETVYGIPRGPGKIIGDVYYDTAFRLAAINLYKLESPIKNMPIRYNVDENELEFKHPVGLRVVQNDVVRSFSWKDRNGDQSFFINAKDFVFGESHLIGFLELIYEADIPVVKRMYTVEKKGQYIPALNAGDQNVQIIKKEKFYFIRNNELYEIASKKKLAESFPAFEQELLEFMKKNDSNLKDAESLKLVFDFISKQK